MAAEVILEAEAVTITALYIQSVVDGAPTVQEVARLTHSVFVGTMRICEEGLELTGNEGSGLFIQALIDFWATKLDVVSSDILVEQDNLCLPAAEPFKW